MKYTLRFHGPLKRVSICMKREKVSYTSKNAVSVYLLDGQNNIKPSK